MAGDAAAKKRDELKAGGPAFTPAALLLAEIERLKADLAEARRTITAREAQQCLGIPRGTIRAWVAQGKLHYCDVDANRKRLYWLVDVLYLRDNTRRRRQHARPARCGP